MALPRESDTYEDYTDQLVYFSARLAANPVTAFLAPRVDKILAEMDSSYEALRAARREEIRKRALRDHQDNQGDEATRKFRRRLSIAGREHIVRVFPKGVSHAVAPRGRAQVERLDGVSQAIDELLISPKLAADPDVDEIKEILEAGKKITKGAADALRRLVDDWEQQTLVVSRARDVFNFRRSDGVNRTGVIVGELRAVLGGSARAAYAYTQSGRSNSAAVEDEPDTPDPEPDHEPDPET